MLRRANTNLGAIGIIADPVTAEAAYPGLDCRQETAWPYGNTQIMCAYGGQTGYIFDGSRLDDPLMLQALRNDIQQQLASKAAGTGDAGQYLYTQTVHQVYDPTPVMLYNTAPAPAYIPPPQPAAAPAPASAAFNPPPPPAPAPAPASAPPPAAPSPAASSEPAPIVPPAYVATAQPTRPAVSTPISNQAEPFRGSSSSFLQLAENMPWWGWALAAGGLLVVMGGNRK